jgi:hypothetical protein
MKSSSRPSCNSTCANIINLRQSGETVSLRRSGPYLVKSPARAVAGPPFKTGTLIPQSGIYKVIHGEHRLPHEVILFQDEQFPRCSKCRDKVSFELVYPAVEVRADRSFRVLVHELPVLEPESSAA